MNTRVRRGATRVAESSIDDELNAVAEPDIDISADSTGADDGFRVLVTAAREDLQIAADVERVLTPVAGRDHHHRSRIRSAAGSPTRG